VAHNITNLADQAFCC